MVGTTGFEPKNEQHLNHLATASKAFNENPYPHIGTQSLGADCLQLAQICDSWERIPKHLKEVINMMCSPYSQFTFS